jgi:NAD(P)-dependent dehydrogenase (short-subunit alcohol dehydrogenase family)
LQNAISFVTLPAALGLLADKIAIVTGAGNGIGRATALALAKEGAKVVVNDVGSNRAGDGSSQSAADEVVAAIRERGGTAHASYDDVASADGARAIVAVALREFGGVDVLINNAGILRDKTLLKMEPAMWDAVIGVHLTGSFLCLQAAANAMKDRGKGGSIVNTTSVSGMLGNFGQANYSAAKAGIYGLTRTASIELQRYGIRVNAVAPIAKTRLTEDLPMFEKISDTLSPEHVAPAHVFLASDLAKDVSGVVLAIAGARVSVYKVVESPGKYKDAERGPWTPEELAEHFDAISKI